MIHGLDTSFLIAAEIVEHPEHAAARDTLARLLGAGDQVALAPQVLAEFIHVATDARRFAQPLTIQAAQQVGLQWWTARDAVRVFPDEQATLRFLDWLQQHALGRKRLLDTLLAATYTDAVIDEFGDVLWYFANIRCRVSLFATFKIKRVGGHLILH